MTPLREIIMNVIKQTMLKAVDQSIDMARRAKFDTEDYFGVVEISILGHATLDRLSKEVTLEKLARIEYEMQDMAGNVSQGTVEEYVAMCMGEHRAKLDDLDRVLSQIDREVEAMPDPEQMDLVEEIPISNTMSDMLNQLSRGQIKPNRG